MPTYVLLMRYHSEGMKAIKEDPSVLNKIHEALGRWEAKVVNSYRLLGEWDQCTIFDAPDNFKAYRATLAQEISTTAQTEILPAINYELFSKLIAQEGGTVGPHHWQIKWWAKLGRLAFRRHAYGQWVNPYCKPLTITGQEKF